MTGQGVGMGRSAWIAQQRGRKAVLYVVKVYGRGEEFYKVGVTFDISSRLSRLKTAYRWRTVARYSDWNAGKVWDLEQRLHADFVAFRYAPLSSFAGFTECYAQVKELLTEMPSGTFFLKNSETLI